VRLVINQFTLATCCKLYDPCFASRARLARFALPVPTSVLTTNPVHLTTQHDGFFTEALDAIEREQYTSSFSTRLASPSAV
jgi:hypothetical protein